ncbi:uncharacterized protein A4U43_C02F5050 [Asparagus officinalis]|uniref:Uncharacterized protein n=1 Tax=Asparagus officinalis TaxID=4686 RepID=A0A5P1FHU7_ASPOF|nr:uncharacterized protein A4U43_C02F5050 [Asparagus officinalis]
MRDHHSPRSPERSRHKTRAQGIIILQDPLNVAPDPDVEPGAIDVQDLDKPNMDEVAPAQKGGHVKLPVEVIDLPGNSTDSDGEGVSLVAAEAVVRELTGGAEQDAIAVC